MFANLEALKKKFKGDIFTDNTMRTLYATDASVYREVPQAVTRPKDIEDVKLLIDFAIKNNTSLIPRTAGTSLAGQVVGKGIIVDVSYHWNKIIEVNKEEKWVRVQPGIVLDELNKYLEKYNLFFGPETSTSNRCMIGGMVGNNSCGSHSIIYGTTRDHVLEIKSILSDGNEVEFKAIDEEVFFEKCKLESLEGKIYKEIYEMLSDSERAEEIRREFPKPSIRRRNTGYPIDVLLETAPFTKGKEAFNFCKLLTGSGGTLAFTTEIKLNLVSAPPKHKAVVAVHLNTINEAAKANLIGLKYHPGAIELMDDIILQCTKSSAEHSKNRFFVQGDPGALLIVEFARNSREEIDQILPQMEADMRANGLGYYFPVLYNSDVNKVWALRKAGLGLLANVPGDSKAVACIEDTAVDVEDQPAYLEEFQAILDKYGMKSVYYAHIGDGEIHLRPILDLKIQKDRDLFYTITDEVATLVKKYNGSLSGEHGDGRVRGEFIRKMIGENNYQLCCDLKQLWDPYNIFNPNKIVHTPKMNEHLRYESGQETRQFETVMDFSESQGILRLAEQCNGSGDCRKSSIIGGTMCPSYMATKSEKDTTRARANILREFLTRSEKINKFNHEEIYDVMDLCLSCKGCKSECPSNVDVAKLKAEFLQQYYDANGLPLRSRLIGNFAKANAINSYFPQLANFVMSNKISGGLMKKVLGIAPQRPLPLLSLITLKKWANRHLKEIQPKQKIGKVYLFADEYTNFNESEIGIKAIQLLTSLGYEVELPEHKESGRTFISKGMLRAAKEVAIENVTLLKDKISETTPLIGIEPSAILGFRDEYPSLVGENLKEKAQQLSKNCLLIDEFISREVKAGRISSASFEKTQQNIKLHGHCHQKALSSLEHTKIMLSLPEGTEVDIIPSGCCGMAGSFGYEQEHYDLSQQIGELILFPTVRKSANTSVIAAPGTSCRHQIKDGTGVKALHPIEILYQALRK
ncbi:MAG: FAD-binding oxidoreductase [Cytophagales bacterium]|nr:MAG: FAD-binding oxidoreductase [Cytophagales bacterium]